MNALPEPFRMVVYYADVEGLKYKEIAKIMDIPHGTAIPGSTADGGNCAACSPTSKRAPDNPTSEIHFIKPHETQQYWARTTPARRPRPGKFPRLSGR
jgi:hypothetical protein